MEYDFKKIESKWQKEWEKKKVFEVKDFGGPPTKLKASSKSTQSFERKNKFYVLDMFPYPSATGLHMGHAFVYSLGDIFARFKRLQGFNVLYPIGYDALGLPAENAAIKNKTHPEEYTKKSIANFMKQQKAMGWSYDWSRMFKTSDPEFYKWDQWIFLQLFKKGLAYRKKSAVNWCPSCKTVLANEQAQGGVCERCHSHLEIKHLEQWYFKITNYAEELNDHSKLDWPERAKVLQKNWIGRSEGTEIDFEIENPGDKISKVVIVHGSPIETEEPIDKKTATYYKHWMPWLKRELTKKKIKGEFPLMPIPWEPKYEKWKKVFEKNKIDENSILIGHSAGTTFLVRWLGETKKKIKKLILVAPWKSVWRNTKENADFCNYKIEECIKENVGEVIIFTSNNEEEDGKKGAKIFQESLNGKIIELRDRGHYCLNDMGTEEFPELLNEIVSKNKKWPIFTTRSDTIFGVTFMVISAQHPRLFELVTKEQKKEVENFLKKLKSVSEKEMADMEKDGVFTGSYAINPMTKEKIPVWAGNFVVADYGSGMVMAVPAHDQRDFEFAKKYGIKIKFVINSKESNLNAEKISKAFTDYGKLINSGNFNGLFSDEAIVHITKFLEEKKLGKKVIQYKLRDWLISRQRYWGTPIPVVYCDKCGIVPFSEKDLPVELPKIVKFGEGNPLLTNEKWVSTKCPKCNGKAKRETDTMDTFVNSSWYYLRYCDPKNKKEIFEKKKVDYWCPIDQYIGGPEHITMHLIYIRFYTKFLRDLGLLNFNEPALKYFTQGLVYGSDGEKMSKSRGNVVEPFETIQKFGADTLRLALMSFASPENSFSWDESIVFGSHKFLKNVYDYFSDFKPGKLDPRVESKLNKIIKEVTEEVYDFKHNLAIIKIRELFSYFSREKTSKNVAESFLKLLSIYCPHITEELWHKLGNKSFISLEKWPIADEKKINFDFEKEEQAVEKLSADINNVVRIVSEKSGKSPSKVFVYVLPQEKNIFAGSLELIKKKTNLDAKVFAVNDKDKYDPENKSKNVKPGRPGIYLE